MFGSKYRHPHNKRKLMGQEQPLGKAYAIMAVMMYGPNLPTEMSLHKDREQIFSAAAPYALSSADIEHVSAHPDDDEKRVYFQNLLTTSCRPFSTLLYNEARNFFQSFVFTSPKINLEYKLHLGLESTQSVFDQYVKSNSVRVYLHIAPIPLTQSPFLCRAGTKSVSSTFARHHPCAVARRERAVSTKSVLLLDMSITRRCTMQSRTFAVLMVD